MKENNYWPNSANRRKVLKTSAVAIAGSGSSTVASATDKTINHTEILAGNKNNPVSKKAIRNSRSKLLQRHSNEDRVLLEQNITDSEQKIIGYALQLDNGVPREYFGMVPKNADDKVFRQRESEIHKKVQALNRGDI